jgi:hypothetical protein
MKVTYIENLPLDGAGTMINPAYKWLPVERTEYCDSISKAGELWYMFRGGFVHHSIDPTKITSIEDAGIKAECKHYRDGSHPFTCKFIERDGRCYGAGYSDFSHLIRDFYQLKYNR